MCFVQGQGQKYGQKHETKELVEFHNHLYALTMLQATKNSSIALMDKTAMLVPKQ